MQAEISYSGILHLLTGQKPKRLGQMQMLCSQIDIVVH